MGIVRTLAVAAASAVTDHGASVARAHDSRVAVHPAIDRHPASLDRTNLSVLPIGSAPAVLQGHGPAASRLILAPSFVRAASVDVRGSTSVGAGLAAPVRVCWKVSVSARLAAAVCVRRSAFVPARLATTVRIRRSTFVHPCLVAPVRVR